MIAAVSQTCSVRISSAAVPPSESEDAMQEAMFEALSADVNSQGLDEVVHSSVRLSENLRLSLAGCY